MNYGLYLSAAGALTSMHRQDVIANNLANVNTVGFKPDVVDARTRLPQRLESLTADADPQFMLEQLGGGQWLHPTRINLTQGHLAETGNDLDLAIRGEGFFVVQTGRGASPESIRFTRDGRLTLNASGELVMAATGMRVLDEDNEPIRLSRNAKITINPNGEIEQNGAPVAKLQISTVADKRALTKEGNNLLRVNGANVQAASGAVIQGRIESSAVDPILSLNAMINASKAVAANATMMKYHDTILGQAINTFGKVG